MLAKIFGLIIMGFSLVLIGKNDLGGIEMKQDNNSPSTYSTFPLQVNQASFKAIPVLNNLNRGFQLSYTSFLNNRSQEHRFPQNPMIQSHLLENNAGEKVGLPLEVTF